MPVNPAFLDTVSDLFAFVAGLRVKRMFGGAGVFSGELMFGLVFEESLYLRADEQTRGVFEAEGLSQFTYSGKDGAKMALGYWRAPDAVWDDAEAARRWAQAAIDAALRKKATQRGPRKAKAQTLLITGPWDEGD